MLFLHNPSTDEITGPFTEAMIRQLYAKGGYEQWGLAKSKSGPWSPLMRVRGLPPPPACKPVDETPSDNSAKVSPTAKQSEQATPKKQSSGFSANVGRKGVVSPSSAIRALLLAGSCVLFAALCFSDFVTTTSQAAEPSPQQLSNEQPAVYAQVSSGYRSSFLGLYEQVQAELAEISSVQRRDMPGKAKKLSEARQSLLEPSDKALFPLHGNLRTAARDLIDIYDVYYKLGGTEVALETSGGDYRVGGMSNETESLFKLHKRESEKLVQARLASASECLRRIENDPLFQQVKAGGMRVDYVGYAAGLINLLVGVGFLIHGRQSAQILVALMGPILIALPWILEPSVTLLVASAGIALLPALLGRLGISF